MIDEEKAEPEDPHNNNAGHPGYPDLPDSQGLVCYDEAVDFTDDEWNRVVAILTRDIPHNSLCTYKDSTT